jgi:hypothetical protein
MDAVQIVNLWQFGDRRPELAAAIRGMLRRYGHDDTHEALVDAGFDSNYDSDEWERLCDWAEDELKGRRCREFHSRMCSR